MEQVWSSMTSTDGIGERFITQIGQTYFWTFLLILMRFSGLFAIGPLLAHSAIPPQTRVLLSFTLAMILTPAVTSWNLNTAQALQQPLVAIPSTILDAGWVAGQELFIGMSIGLGVMLILSGIQMAGEFFDQQSGIALGEVFNPMFDAPSSPTNQILSMAGVVFLFCMNPLGGDLLMVRALIETFRNLPVGASFDPTLTINLLSSVFHQSLILALQVAAPLLAAQTLINLAIGFLGYSVPQINIMLVGFGIRASSAASYSFSHSVA